MVPAPDQVYLQQRVLTASPEQQMALLMEAGQKFLGNAIRAMGKGEHISVGVALSRVAEILNECIYRLNHREGGELVANLMTIYDRWIKDLFEAQAHKDTSKLENMLAYMGELRQTWEQLNKKNQESK